jgi:hypothetical protein
MHMTDERMSRRARGADDAGFSDAGRNGAPAEADELVRSGFRAADISDWFDWMADEPSRARWARRHDDLGDDC